jgi:hypothetical protein
MKMRKCCLVRQHHFPKLEYNIVTKDVTCSIIFYFFEKFVHYFQKLKSHFVKFYNTIYM